MAATSAWRRLDPERAAELAGARVELHWAAQIPAAVGACLLSSREDAETLGWSPSHEALLGRAVHAGGARLGLRPRDLTLLVVAGPDVIGERSLLGRTLTQGLRWVAAALDPLGKGLPTTLARPDYAELPDHPASRGEPFSAADAFGLFALSDWIADAHHLLEAVRAATAGASEVRFSPRSLELATRIDRDETGRGIDVGLSLGDRAEASPYFYVAPDAFPEAREALPSLPTYARWSSDGRLGALAPGTALSPEPDAQAQQGRAFFEDAIRACREIRAR